MSILNKELVSISSPIWVGFQHFVLTGVVLYLANMVFLSAFGIFWGYGQSNLVLVALFIILTFISVSISPLLFKKKLRASDDPKKVLRWSFIFAAIIVIPFAFMLTVEEGELVAGIAFALIILLVYYFTSDLLFKKIKGS